MVVECVNMAASNTVSTVDAHAIRRRGGGSQSGFHAQQQQQQQLEEDLVRFHSGSRQQQQQQQQREHTQFMGEFVSAKDVCRRKKVRFLVALLRVIGMPFLSRPVCLLASPCDMDMTAGEGRVCGEEGWRVSHREFESTFVVDPGARHGIACHCCSLDSSVFSSSLALEMDPDGSFIFS